MKKFFIYFLIAFVFIPSSIGFLTEPQVLLLGGAQEAYAGPIDAVAEAIKDALKDIGDDIKEAIIDAANDFATAVIRLVGNIVLQLFAFGLYVAGLFLDLVVTFTVLNLGEVLSSNNLPIIEVGWTIFRDIANLAFIFMLLYAAIALILELSNVNVAKIIRNVVIVALLINFSLFFTQVIVDTSNALASRFYTDIIDASESNTISGALMDKLRITSVYNNDGSSATSLRDRDDAGDLLIKIAGGALLILTAIAVFFAIAIMLLIRFVIIIFLMMTAPIAFIASVIPNTSLSKLSKDWWGSLISNAIFAPALFLLLFVVIQMASTLNGAISTGTGSTPGRTIIASGGGGDSSAIASFMSFLIVNALLVGTLVLAKKMGASGANGAIAFGGAAAFGAAGFAGRRVGGFAGSRIRDSRLVQRGLNSDSRIARGAARLGLRTGDKIARGTYDLRNTKTFKGAASAVGGALGEKLDFGKGVSRKDLDKKAKDRAEFAKKAYGVSDSYKQKERDVLAKKTKEARSGVQELRTVDRDIDERAKKLTQTQREISDLEKQVAENKKNPARNESDAFAQQRDELELAAKMKEAEKLEKEGADLARRKGEIESSDVMRGYQKQKARVATISEKGETEKQFKERTKRKKGESTEAYEARVASEGGAKRKKSVTEKRQGRLASDVEKGPLGKYSFLVGKTKKARIDAGAALRKEIKTDKDKEYIEKLKADIKESEGGGSEDKTDTGSGDDKDTKET